MSRHVAGGTDFVNISSALVTAVPFTISAWYKQDTAADGLFHTVGGLFSSNTLNNAYYCEVGTTGTATTVVADAGNFTSSTSGSNIGDSNWHHIAGVFSTSSNNLVYLDGVAGTANTTTHTVAGINETCIAAADINNDGAHHNNSGHAVGEFAIWNVALTADEVAALAKGESPKRIRPGALVHYLPLWGKSSPEPDFGQRSSFTVSGTTAVNPPPVRRFSRLASPLTIVGDITFPLAGQSVTSAQGAIKGGPAPALPGQSLTAAQGSILEIGASVTFNLPGLPMGLGQGSLIGGTLRQLTLPGLSMKAQQGQLWTNLGPAVQSWRVVDRSG